jgi:hypothetical protein
MNALSLGRARPATAHHRGGRDGEYPKPHRHLGHGRRDRHRRAAWRQLRYPGQASHSIQFNNNNNDNNNNDNNNNNDDDDDDVNEIRRCLNNQSIITHTLNCLLPFQTEDFMGAFADSSIIDALRTHCTDVMFEMAKDPDAPTPFGIPLWPLTKKEVRAWPCQFLYAVVCCAVAFYILTWRPLFI